MKEVEKKEIITKEQYLTCLEYLTKKQSGKRKIQINYYFDTDDLNLFMNHETLRVRQTDDKLKLEYKFNKSLANNVRTCDEYAIDLNSLPAIINNESLNLYNCKYIGMLITERHDFQFDKTLISLDKNYYLGIIDYEIEIESEDDFKNAEFLTSLSITFNKPIIGKYQRFINQFKSWQVDTYG